MLPAPSTRLRFREMTRADLDDMADLLGDPRVMEFYPAPKSRDDAARWIAWNEDNYAAHGFGLWIVETHAGLFVGDCGLTWQDGLLDFDRAETPVRTASVWQVREPLHTRSSGRWRNYAEQLRPIVDLLGRAEGREQSMQD